MSENLKFLSQIKKETGQNIPLRPFERILKVKLEENSATVLVETFRYNETNKYITLWKKGQKLITVQSGKVHTFTTWEEGFQPQRLQKYGKVYEGKSWEEKLSFERSCFRPGNSKVPLDNYERVLAAASTPQMEKYW